ncbi:hypothetical protein Hdeb2414_s0005g00155011 [Helianthus debilis subsp. tardiflorus]
MVVLSNRPAMATKIGQAKEALTALHRSEVNHNPMSKNLLYAATRGLSRRIMGEEAGDDKMVYKRHRWQVTAEDGDCVARVTRSDDKLGLRISVKAFC